MNKLFLLFKNSKKSDLVKNDSADYRPNVQTIVDKTQSISLPIVRNQIENYKINDQEIQSNQIKRQKQTNIPKKIYHTKVILLSTIHLLIILLFQHKPRSDYNR